jgi:hypothetical protein
VEVAEDAGIEGRSFFLAEGRSTGRLSARYRGELSSEAGRWVAHPGVPGRA